MDYRIFNVRTWSFLCVRQHTGVGHKDNETALHFGLCKNSHKLFLCSWRGLNLGSLDLESRCSTNRATSSPMFVQFFIRISFFLFPECFHNWICVPCMPEWLRRELVFKARPHDLALPYCLWLIGRVAKDTDLILDCAWCPEAIRTVSFSRDTIVSGSQQSLDNTPASGSRGDSPYHYVYTSTT